VLQLPSLFLTQPSLEHTTLCVSSDTTNQEIVNDAEQMKLLHAHAGLKRTQQPVTHPRPPSCRFHSGQSNIDARYGSNTYPDLSNIDKSTADCCPVQAHKCIPALGISHQGTKHWATTAPNLYHTPFCMIACSACATWSGMAQQLVRTSQ
jgi:hypothetical protein